MTGKEGYIGGPTGGVPKEIFNPDGYNGKTKGASGRQLRCVVSKNRVDIKTPKGQIFIAWMNKEGILNLDIKTKDQYRSSEKHPDLYAAQLTRHSISYFEDQGLDINGIRGYWLKRFGSDNFDSYYDYLDRIKATGGKEGIGRKINRNDKINAARSTWTGRLAHSLGYDDVRFVSTFSKEEVCVVFEKPKN